MAFSQVASTWKEIKAKGKGDIIIYWETSKPFIYPDTDSNLMGIEYEIMELFKRYLKTHYGVEVKLHWVKTSSFSKIIDTIQSVEQKGIFGSSAFSSTRERRQKVNFSPSYMSDITVMISSGNIPIVKTPEEFDQIFSNLTAITIKGTTYDNDLKNLKEIRNLNFDVNYIPSRDNILNNINARDSVFGYIDLPIYLMAFKRDATLKVRRQNLFSIKRDGYGIIYPKDSEWSIPINSFFSDHEINQTFQDIISKYIDYEIYNFIERYYEDNISLLTKEKEIQNRELINNALQIQQARNLRYGLVVILILTLVFALIVYRMYQKRHKAALQLEEQNKKIASQSADIERQRAQLAERSELMTRYNNEKNYLIKVLAHDLRTPINHIQGLAQIFKMENPDLSDSNAEVVDKITRSTERLLAMITKILDVDAVEANRVNLLEEKLDVNEVLQRVVKSFEKEAHEKGIELKFEPFNSPATINADLFYLTEICENLLSNAIKFSPKNKLIRIEVLEENDSIAIKIIDQGPGLTDGDKELLFNKFQTLSAKPTGGEQSTGLGLSIVKKYTELMNGKVGCESTAGDGAIFHVTFKKAK